MMDPQQELFTALLVSLREEFEPTIKVYDAELPADGTAYPFVYLGEGMMSDAYLKNAIHGAVSQTIHVWHDYPWQRGTVSDIASKVKTICRKLQKTNNYGWMIQDISQQMLADTSTAKPLVHCVIDVTYKFS